MHVFETSCCGVNEFSGLSKHASPEQALLAVRAQYQAPASPLSRAAFAMFTGVVKVKGAHGHLHVGKVGRRDNYGDTFATFIRDNRLGDVVAMPVTENPASGNDLGVWMWQINHDALQAWFHANG